MSSIGNRERLSRALRRLDPDRPAGRKTTVTRTRRRKDQMPDYTLSIVLSVGHSLKPGRIEGTTTGTAYDVGRVEFTGKDREFLIGEARALLDRLKIARLECVIERPDEPLTDSGPAIKGYTRTIWIDARNPRYFEKDESGVLAMRTLFD